MRTGNLNQDTDIPRLVDAAQESSNADYIDDTPGLTINQLSSNRDDSSCKSRLGLIVVDYIGLMLGDSRMSRQEVSEASRGLKGLPKSWMSV